MTTNSLILSEEILKEEVKGKKLLMYGCSEFVALRSYVLNYVTICFPMLQRPNTDLHDTGQMIDKSWSAVQYMEEWVKFVYAAFEQMNILPDPFIRLYYWKDLKEVIPSLNDITPDYVFSLEENTVCRANNLEYKFQMTDSTPIGIYVDVAAMRKHFGSNYYEGAKIINQTSDKCRKVQFTHTALRYGWSSCHQVAGIALKIMKDRPNLDPFYVLQLAWSLRGKWTSVWGADYGSLFSASHETISRECFKSRYIDRKNEGVMIHFQTSEDPLLKLLGVLNKVTIDTIAPNTKSVDKGIKMLDKGFYEKYDEHIDYVTNSIDLRKIKCTFIFTSPIFRTTVVNMPYDGYTKKGVNIDRIYFKDEEGTVLSITQKSKLIKLV